MKSKRQIYYIGRSRQETYRMVEDKFTYYAGLYKNMSSRRSIGDIFVEGYVIKQMFHAKGYKLPLSLPINTRLLGGIQ